MVNPRFKKVLLINLPGVEQGGYRPSPLGVLYLAAYIRKFAPKVSVDVVDGAMEGEEVVLNRLKKMSPDLVGISVLTPSRIQAVKMASLVKKTDPSCKVIFGGIHPTLMWKHMMENYKVIDFIARGEGEKILFDLIVGKNLESIGNLVWRKGKLTISNKDRAQIKNLDKIPFPARDLIDPLKYPPRGSGIVNGIDLEKEVRFPIIFSRGCMGTCTFCSSWRVWQGYRFRSGKKVADEVQIVVEKYGAKHFVFQDDTLTGSKEEIRKFCQEIIKRKLKIAIHGTTRVDQVDEKLLKLMKKAGFYKLSYGIESGSPTLLQRINKRTDLKKIMKAINLTKKAGIQVCALMMFGLPGETEEDRKNTQELLKKINPEELGTVGEVWIFPGTVLYQQAKAVKLIDDNFWLSRRPYYIYRGGIGNDPINKKLLIKDWYNFYIEKTPLGKLLNPLLLFKRKYINVQLYHLRHQFTN